MVKFGRSTLWINLDTEFLFNDRFPVLFVAMCMLSRWCIRPTLTYHILLKSILSILRKTVWCYFFFALIVIDDVVAIWKVWRKCRCLYLTFYNFFQYLRTINFCWLKCLMKVKTLLMLLFLLVVVLVDSWNVDTVMSQIIPTC